MAGAGASAASAGPDHYHWKLVAEDGSLAASCYPGIAEPTHPASSLAWLSLETQSSCWGSRWRIPSEAVGCVAEGTVGTNCSFG